MTHRKHNRQSIRAPGFDYRDPGTYFVTICTQHREHLFGEIRHGVMGLSAMGQIVKECIKQIPRHFPGITIDTYVVMPNHVHILVHIGDPPTHDGRDVACYVPTHERSDNTDTRLIGPRAKGNVPTHEITKNTDAGLIIPRAKSFNVPTHELMDNTDTRLIGPRARSLGAIIRSLKSACTKYINESRGEPGTIVWQRNFHEHIVRSQEEYDRIRTYIIHNPRHWPSDSKNA